jgi:uncharacterized coiled-coil DUF342 family protein
MRQQAQEDLMRIISKLINSLGENVSIIEEPPIEGQSAGLQPGGTSNDANLILELSEENEHLKEKIEDLHREVISSEEKSKHLKKEIDEKNK